MTVRISDVHIALEEALPAPSELHAALRLGDVEAAHIAESRRVVQEILSGSDTRLLVVTGPCSIHEPESALDYARRLRDFAPRVADALFLVMRVYFEKPRTRLGWKGLIYDPDLDGRGNIRQGLFDARRLLLECAESVLRGQVLLESLLADRFGKEINIRMLQHAATLDLASFENSQFLDKEIATSY